MSAFCILIEGPPPGMRSAPEHDHMLEEEHALILEGQVTLLLGDERHDMKPGDYACFPAGQRVGHFFINSGKQLEPSCRSCFDAPCKFTGAS